MDTKLNALYVSVKDMERAISFYEQVFGVEVSSKGERMSSFDFDNISFMLFNPAVDGESVVYGNNVVPTFEVNDINKALKLIEDNKCEVVMPLERVEKFLIFQAKDTEGNVIEFYQKT